MSNPVLAMLVIATFCLSGVAFAFAGHPVFGFVIIIAILMATNIKGRGSEE